MSILLTLSTESLAKTLKSKRSDLTLLTLPDFASRELQLRGLHIPTSMLAGWSLEQMDALRDRADKAACPCLVLIEDAALPFGHVQERKRDEAAARISRVAAAAHRLGCNAIGIRCAGVDDEETFERTAMNVKAAMPPVERLELNVLIAPHQGLTAVPERLTDLIKRVGGFRIGSLPSFAHAAGTKDPIDTLRKLSPYAGAMIATVGEFAMNETKGEAKHKDYDLKAYVHAIRSVGFVNTLAIEYVGTGDAVASIEAARNELQSAIDDEGKG